MNKMKALAAADFLKANSKKKVKGLKKIADKMLFNFRNIGLYCVTYYPLFLLYHNT